MGILGTTLVSRQWALLAAPGCGCPWVRQRCLCVHRAHAQVLPLLPLPHRCTSVLMARNAHMPMPQPSAVARWDACKASLYECDFVDCSSPCLVMYKVGVGGRVCG